MVYTSAPGIAVEWRDDLHDADATETLERLGRRVCVALLRRIERVSDLGFDLRWAACIPRAYPSIRLKLYVGTKQRLIWRQMAKIPKTCVKLEHTLHGQRTVSDSRAEFYLVL